MEGTEKQLSSRSLCEGEGLWAVRAGTSRRPLFRRNI